MIHIRKAWNNITRYPAITFDSSGIIFLCVFLLGSSILGAVNIHQFVRVLKEKVEVVAFVKGNISDSGAQRVGSIIETFPHVEKARYISKEDALRDFSKDSQIKKEIELLGENPLPASFSIKVRRKDYATIKYIAAEVKDLPEIEDVKFGENNVKHLMKFLNYIYAFDITIAMVCFVIIIGLLMYLSQIMLQYYKKEIELMLLLGAAPRFLRQIFFVEGVIVGLYSTGVALGVLWIFYKVFSFRLINLIFMPSLFIVILAVLGIMLGVISRFRVIRKCRKVF